MSLKLDNVFCLSLLATLINFKLSQIHKKHVKFQKLDSF